MGDEGLDFSEIQEMFSKRDAAKEQEYIERRSQLKLVKNSGGETKMSTPVKHSREETTMVTPVKHGLDYKKIELRDEPAYDDMTPTNLHITETGYRLCGLQKVALVLCMVVVMVASAILGYLGFNKNSSQPTITNPPGITAVDPNYGQNTGILKLEQCNLSDFTIILRQSTKNVGNIVSVAERELTEMNVDNRVVNYNDDIAEVVETAKGQNNNRDIIVINVDGLANQSSTEMVVMTNYNNDAKSADNLALAISNAGNDIYGIESDIRCGKKVSDGTRTETSVEKALREAGHNDVVCLTVAVSKEQIDTKTEENNIATIIAEAVARLGSINKEERYKDVIRRVVYGDTIYGLAKANGVPEEFLRSVNREVLEATNGNLQYNTALLVSPVNKNLTGKVSIDNPTITTNPDEVGTTMVYYEVKPGDTVSEYAERVGVDPSIIVVPSGDPNKIFPGDIIEYEKETGKILVQKQAAKTK